jgi:poly-gamma-glutamate synthesis protein (capsule biosynthesis protein)
VLFTGNVFWGRYIHDWSQASELGTAYPFSGLADFDRDQWDAWIGGLECPLVEGMAIDSAAQDDTLEFVCSPDYVAEAARWFTVFSLSNNHTADQGPEGLAETRRHLAEAGIQAFGDFDPDQVDQLCRIVALPAQVAYDDGSSAPGHLPLALCGHHGVFKLPSAESIGVITRYADVVPVVAMPHMGVEYVHEPDQLKRDTYRAMIEAGASMVIADHPHVVQPAEVFDGRLIVYSMGNFMFDQQFDSEVTRSAAVDVTFTAPDSPDLAEWLELAPTCAEDPDGCLAAAEASGMARLQLEASYGIVGATDEDRLTHPASPEQTEGILDRLNWDNVLEDLPQNVPL